MFAHLNESLKFLLQTGDFSAGKGIILFNFKAVEIPGIIIRHVIPCNLITGFNNSDERLIVAATLSDINLIIIEYPEGCRIDLQESAYIVRLMHMAGVRTLFMLNTSTSTITDSEFILLMDDHINLTFQSPLTGPNADEFGPRFPDMSEPYDKVLQNEFRSLALKKGIDVMTGVYVYKANNPELPPLETGTFSVGDNLVPEVITAIHADMKVCAFSIVNQGNIVRKTQSDAFLLLGGLVQIKPDPGRLLKTGIFITI